MARHEPLSGREVLGELCDVLTERLPRIDPLDPAYPALATLAPQLAHLLGRAPVARVALAPVDGNGAA